MTFFRGARIATLSGPRAPRTRGAMRDLAIIDDGAFLCVRGRIQWIGRRDSVPANLTAETVDLGGRLVLPGFVDAHTHLVFGGSRAHEFECRCGGATYEEIAAAGGGIRSTVAQTRACDEETLFQSGRRSASWMLKCGTTTAEAKSGYGLSEAGELAILSVIARVGKETPLRTVGTFLGLHAVPPEYYGDHDGYVRHVCEDLVPLVAARRLADYVDAFVEEGYFTHNDARRLATAAKAHGLGVRLHVDQLTNSEGARLAAELGAITADHLEQTDVAGIEAMATAGVMPVLLPASVFALRKKRYPDARAMMDAGLPVVLASDFNPGSSPTPSMPFVMSLACIEMGMTSAEAIVASTINAACSLKMGDDVGSLEVGKVADFVAFDLEDPREIPYWIAAPIVHAVYVRGKAIEVSN